jgi:Fe-S-cluster-containing dehydrogenase component/CRP-like cAMP-binding protein
MVAGLISRGNTIFQQVNDLSEDLFYIALKKCIFLENVQEHLLKDLIAKSPKRIIKQNDWIFNQGEYGHSLFILVKGKIALFDPINTLDVVHEEFENIGDYFGQDVVIGDLKRSLSAQVISEEMVCIELEKSRLERTDLLANGIIFKALRSISVEAYLSNHPFLKQLSTQALRKFKNECQLLNINRLTEINIQKLGNVVIFVKQGVLKLFKQENNQENILSYFNIGDLLNLQYLQANQSYYHLLSMEFSQVFVLDFKVYETLSKKDQELMQSFEFLPRDRLNASKSSKTVFGFVENMIEEGAHQGLSLLTINLDHCVRCGNCVQACESRHGHSKFTRKGKALVRRKNIEVEGDYQKLLIPSSCRHCTNPECMIGCPTGAIHRAPGGEVDIKDFCIGCGSCANRCPYGNITMVTRDEEEIEAGKSELLASKCNLCSGYDEPNCVHNCPTGAVLRVEPTSYFQELVDVLGQGNHQNPKNATEHHVPKDIYLLPILSVLIVSIAAWFFHTSYLTIWDGVGFSFGIISTIFMFLSFAIAARKRMAGFRIQFGSLRLWTNAHLYFGLLAFVFMLFHSKGSSGKWLTSILYYACFGEILLGLVGLWLYKILLPNALSNLEAKSQVEEDAVVEVKEIEKKIDQLRMREKINQLHGTIKKSLPGYFKMLRKNYRRNDQIKSIQQKLNSDEIDLKNMIELLISKSEVECSLMLYQLRRRWIFTHLGMSVVVIFFVCIHIFFVIKTFI